MTGRNARTESTELSGGETTAPWKLIVLQQRGKVIVDHGGGVRRWASLGAIFKPKMLRERESCGGQFLHTPQHSYPDP